MFWVIAECTIQWETVNFAGQSIPLFKMFIATHVILLLGFWRVRPEFFSCPTTLLSNLKPPLATLVFCLQFSAKMDVKTLSSCHVLLLYLVFILLEARQSVMNLVLPARIEVKQELVSVEAMHAPKVFFDSFLMFSNFYQLHCHTLPTNKQTHK